jgi:hypothetical protein
MFVEQRSRARAALIIVITERRIRNPQSGLILRERAVLSRRSRQFSNCPTRLSSLLSSFYLLLPFLPCRCVSVLSKETRMRKLLLLVTGNAGRSSAN